MSDEKRYTLDRDELEQRFVNTVAELETATGTIQQMRDEFDRLYDDIDEIRAAARDGSVPHYQSIASILTVLDRISTRTADAGGVL